MSSSPYTTTISISENTFLNPYSGYYTTIDEVTKQDNKKTNEAIVIQDIKDLSFGQVVDTNFLVLVGLVPNKSIFADWQKKLLLSSFFSILLSIWISNQFVLSVFILLNIINFITSLFTEKETPFRLKFAYLINEVLLIGIISAITESLIGKIPILFLPFSISIFYLAAFFMNIHYIYKIVFRLFPLTSLSKSKTFINLMLSIKDGYKHGQDEFAKRQEKEIKTS